MINTADMTPSEIDTILSEIWTQRSRVESYLATDRRRLESHEAALRGERYIGTGRTRRSTYKMWDRDVELVNARIARQKAELAELAAQAAPYEAEFNRRPWSRFFLVLNNGGHIHRERSCSTCRWDTSYAWMPELSGVTEAEMVERHGMTACTVCFPSAPAHPAYIQAQLDAEKAEQAKADAKCKGSGQYSTKPGRRYDYCPNCGHYTSLTSTGKYRSHKLPGA